MSHDQKRQIASVRASYYYQQQQTAAAADANKPSTSECFTRARWFNSISLHTSRATPPPDHTGLTPSPSTPAPRRGYPTPRPSQQGSCTRTRCTSPARSCGCSQMAQQRFKEKKQGRRPPEAGTVFCLFQWFQV